MKDKEKNLISFILKIKHIVPGGGLADTINLKHVNLAENYFSFLIFCLF